MKQYFILLGLVILIIVFLIFKEGNVNFNEIIQVPISKLTDDLLFENQPIIISDNVVSLEQVIDVSFTWGMYIYKQKIDLNSERAMNKYKYLLCHNNHLDQSINIIINNIEIILGPGNVLIIPYGISYQCKNEKLSCIGLHNIYSSIKSLFL